MFASLNSLTSKPTATILERMNDRTDTLYKFIRQYIEDNGRPPSLREMATAIDSKSTSIATYHRDLLIEAGLLEHEPEIARGIRLPKDDSNV